MFLDLDNKVKLVFSLQKRLQREPIYIEKAQALTLNTNKPFIGLKGTHGLYGSDEWWCNLYNGVIPTVCYSGQIIDVYEAGQDKIGRLNTVKIILPNDSFYEVAIYVNNENDRSLYKSGSKLYLVKAFNELKYQPRDSNNKNYSEITLELAVSID